MKGVGQVDTIVLLAGAAWEDAHIPRAVVVFQKLGLSPIPAPADFGVIWNKLHFFPSTGGVLKETISALPSSNNLAHSERALHEYAGFI